MARRAWALLRAQMILLGALYLTGIAAFVHLLREADPDYAKLALEGHRWTALSSNLKIVPAYLLVALAYTALLLPVLARSRALAGVAARHGWLAWLRLLAWLIPLDVALYFLSWGPFFSRNPGLIDGVARVASPMIPGVDMYAIYRWHLLDVASVGLAALGLYAAWFYSASWWRGARGRARWLPLGLAGLTAGGLLWPASAPPVAASAASAPLNVLIIASDSLRADRLGVHGYHRADISPNIDRFAAEAADFRQAHVATASTLESWMTFLSGQFPPTHGLRYMYPRREQAEAAGKSPDLLTRQLAAAGYQTIVVSNWAGNCFKLVDMGFERNLAASVQNFDAMIMEAAVWAHMLFPTYFTNSVGEWLLPEVRRITRYLRPQALADRMLAEIDASAGEGRPFFGLVFFSTTHLPYSVSYPFNMKYVDPAYDGPHRYQIDVTVHQLITTGFRPRLAADVQAQIRNLYDGAVSEFDHYVGQLLAALRARGLLERTIVIVTSDHGEDLYEPGSTLGHGTNFFGGDQSTEIPLLIRVPEGGRAPGSQGRRIEALVRNADLAATLLELLGLTPPASYEGTSLLPLMTGAADDLDLPVFAETCYLFFPKDKALLDLSDEERADLRVLAGAKDTLELDPDFNNNMVLRADLHQPVIDTKDRMVRTRRWKLIHIPGKTHPILRLYDLVADPTQRHDRAAELPSVTRRLQALLGRYWSGQARELRWTRAEESPDWTPAP